MTTPTNCKMCGHVTFNLVQRWYQYDNGEQFIASVCPPCAKIHDRLVKAG